MIWNYLKIAYRCIKRNPLISFINIFGLGLSLSVGLMQAIITQSELGFDKFHPHPERTYRITSAYTQKNGSHWRLASTPLPLSAALSTDSVFIEDEVTIYPAFNGTTTSGTKELSINGAFTGPSFFNIFGFTLAEGDPRTALRLPNTVVITKSTAERFFGHEDPLGKQINIPGRGLFVVTGLLNDVPGKSHISFDAYASATSIPLMEKSKLLPAKSDDWNDFRAAYTYVLLRRGVGKTPLTGRLHSMAAGFNRLDRNGQTNFEIQAIEKVRPADEDLYNDIGAGNTWSKLLAGVYVSLIILLAACFNYTNLTIARALTRAREVGIRKIAGAKRYQLFTQYIVESVVIALLALAFAWILLGFIIHYAPFNDGYEMIPSSWKYNGPYILCTIGFALFTGLLAGAAPAWILSAFKPVRVLKSLSTAKIFGKVGLQKTLIVFQYSLSLVIIIFLLTFYRQFAYLGSENPGFKRENVLVLPLANTDASIVAQKMAAISGVRSVSGLSATLSAHFSGKRSSAWVDNGQKDAVSLNYYYTDASFIPAMDLKLLAGRNFDSWQDSSAEKDIILNVQATKSLGFRSCEKALGTKLWVNDSTALTIAGIVKDFHYENAGKPIAPMAFRTKHGACSYLFISVDSVGSTGHAANTDHEAITARIEQAWKELEPSGIFAPSWLDEDLAKSNSQNATLSLLGYLAFIALSIATLGLFGLVIYTVESRRKEISIRKIVGAGKWKIVYLLSKGFIRLLFIAGAIGLPIGYALSFLFLRNFADRVGNLGIAAIMCFIFLLSIGLLTVVSRTYNASAVNPVDALRGE